jgi:excinuclease ABC subunit A
VLFPLGNFICVTGVSGSGKSSLIVDTLFKRLDDFLNKSLNKNEKNFNIKGTQNIDKIIDINQSPIGRTPRSNPATYTGCFTPIRDWFTGLNESLARGYKPGRFSFNVKGGRCENCEGDGVKKIEMHFLADVYIKCISIFLTPSPSQFSHLPPFTLKENLPGLYPLAKDSFKPVNQSRIGVKQPV